MQKAVSFAAPIDMKRDAVRTVSCGAVNGFSDAS